MSDDVKEFVFKIVVLGDAAVGKTSLINQYIEHSFQEDYKPTLGANIIRKDIHVEKYLKEVGEVFVEIAKAIEEKQVERLLDGPIAQRGFYRLTKI